MAMDPKRCGANRLDRNMAVGPSAPPMIPMEAASKRSNWIPGIHFDNTRAPTSVVKMPTWAAAPSRAVFGLAEKNRKLLKKRGRKRYIEFLSGLNFIKNVLELNELADIRVKVDHLFDRINIQDGIFIRSFSKHSFTPEAWKRHCGPTAPIIITEMSH